MNPIGKQELLLNVMFNYAGRIGKAQDTETLLQLNAAMSRDLSGAERCSIWMVDQQSNELYTKVAHGIDEIRIPFGYGLVGAAIEHHETMLINDTAADPRFLSAIDKS